MATYTPNRGYAQPQNNGDVGLWGTLWDQTMTILDNNMGAGGNAPLSVAGAIDVTPSPTQAQYLVQYLTGALTGNISYLMPATGWFAIFRNGTTGAFSLTVKTITGGSTGVAVPQGGALFLWSDATNVYATDVSAVTGTFTTATASNRFVAPEFQIDSGYYLVLDTGNPIINLDATDYINYDRTLNKFGFAIGGAFALTVAASGVVMPGTASVVGLLSAPVFRVGATGAQIYSGTGSPEGVQTGNVGDVFLRTDLTPPAALGSRFYVKESGNATLTGWVGK